MIVTCHGCGKVRQLATVNVPTSDGRSAPWVESPPRTWLLLRCSDGEFRVCGRRCAVKVTAYLPKGTWMSAGTPPKKDDEDDEVQ